MKTDIISLSGLIATIFIDKEPDKCPICHNFILPLQKTGYEIDKNKYQLIFMCPNLNCHNLFIGYYGNELFLVSDRNAYLMHVAPKKHVDHEFSECIIELSPDFVYIFNQAEAANSINLDQVYGIGLRKSLEFLIKDYLIKLNPELKDHISKMNLSKCIKEHIDDVRIKQCAERAVWLGNDETHYMRLWDNKNIKDLYALIKITLNWIENNLLFKKYMDEMPKGKQ
ncbi:MAG: DUF4145 domain-containing protein [Bacteroidetes bacterium]|nr:DUF4145 domain-containing protein [Bacteroidota bacterium]